MKTQEELLDAADKICEEYFNLSKEENGWESVKTHPKLNISIYRRPSCFTKGHVFKAETTVYGSVDRTFDILHPSTTYYKVQWDPHVRQCDVLQELSRDTVLMHFQLKPAFMGLITCRDSIEIGRFVDHEDESKSIVLGSVDHEDYPPTANFIRGWSYPAGATVSKSSEPDRSLVRVIFQGELNSKHIPRGLFEKAMPTLLMQFMQGMHKAEIITWKPLVDVPGRRGLNWLPPLLDDNSDGSKEIEKSEGNSQQVVQKDEESKGAAGGQESVSVKL